MLMFDGIGRIWEEPYRAEHWTLFQLARRLNIGRSRFSYSSNQDSSRMLREVCKQHECLLSRCVGENQSIRLQLYRGQFCWKHKLNRSNRIEKRWIHSVRLNGVKENSCTTICAGEKWYKWSLLFLFQRWNYSSRRNSNFRKGEQQSQYCCGLWQIHHCWNLSIRLVSLIHHHEVWIAQCLRLNRPFGQKRIGLITLSRVTIQLAMCWTSFSSFGSAPV